MRTFFLTGCMISAGFILMDGIWIWTLPRLGVSYGEMIPTLMIFAAIQAMILVGCLILLACLNLFKFRFAQKITMIIFVVLSLLLFGAGLYGFYYEPFHLTVSRIQVQVPGLNEPVRIVQLSDIHVERTTRREQEIPGVVAGLKPDMIVLTGDYLNESYAGDDLAVDDLRSMVRQFHAPLGIYAVNGNVEEPWMLTYLFKKTDVRILYNEVLRIPQIDKNFVLMGLDYVDPLADEITLRKMMDQVLPEDFTLLLYHKPDLACAARDLKIDLYLAGHTHGGQVRLPIYGAIYANSRYGKTFEMGLYHLDPMTLFVSRGLGMSGGSAPRIRFLAPPEVVVIDLVPQK